MTKGHTPRAEARRLSVDEAAPLLGVSVYMVRSLVRQRRLPYHRVGRRIILDREDIERFLQAHRVEAREIRVDPPHGKRATVAKRPGAAEPSRPPIEPGQRSLNDRHDAGPEA